MDAASFISPYFLGFLGLVIGSFLSIVAYQLPRIIKHRRLKAAALFFASESLLTDVVGLRSKAARRTAERAGTVLVELGDAPKIGLALLPRSSCPNCSHTIAWYKNVPLVSWLMLGGKCSACKEPLPVRYPLVELATAVLFAGIAVVFGPTPTTLVWCWFAALLVTLVAGGELLFDAIAPLLLVTGLLATLFGLIQPPGTGTIFLTLLAPLLGPTLTTPLGLSILGVVMGYVSMCLLHPFYASALSATQPLARGETYIAMALGSWAGGLLIIPIVLVISAGAALRIQDEPGSMWRSPR